MLIGVIHGKDGLTPNADYNPVSDSKGVLQMAIDRRVTLRRKVEAHLLWANMWIDEATNEFGGSLGVHIALVIGNEIHAVFIVNITVLATITFVKKLAIQGLVTIEGGKPHLSGWLNIIPIAVNIIPFDYQPCAL